MILNISYQQRFQYTIVLNTDRADETLPVTFVVTTVTVELTAINVNILRRHLYDIHKRNVCLFKKVPFN